MARSFGALAALLLVTGALGAGDAVSMIQRNVLGDVSQFNTGDHVLVTLPGQQPLKGSITGKGEDLDTYDVHVWVGPTYARERKNVAAQYLEDASPAEAKERSWLAEDNRRQQIEAEKQRQEEQERAVAAAAQRKLQREEQARQRAAEEQARKVAEAKAAEEARLQAMEAARLKAERDAEEKARAEAEAKLEKEAADRRARQEEMLRQELAEQEKRRIAEEQEAQRLAEEKAAAKRAADKKRWEAEKALKLHAAGLEDAPKMVQNLVLRSDAAQEVLKAKAKAEAAQARAGEQASGTVRFTVKSQTGELVHMVTERDQPFRVAMNSFIHRLGLQDAKTRFFFRNAEIKSTDTPTSVFLRNNDVLTTKTEIVVHSRKERSAKHAKKPRM